MKKLILSLITISMLAGCSYNNIYVLYDSRGCAFSVDRSTGFNENSDTWNNKGGSGYRATIMRLPSEDKSTCPLNKD